jgi:hypothetical protein
MTVLGPHDSDPPIDGKANQELIALVAERFNVRKSQVLIRLWTVVPDQVDPWLACVIEKARY